MDKEFQLLFKGNDPSVRLFKSKMQGRPAEEVNAFYNHAYTLALTCWATLSIRMQDFLVRLVKNDRQRFVNFTNAGILGRLRYKLEDPVLAARLLALSRPTDQDRMSYNHLAQNFLIGFDCPLKIDSLADRIAPKRFTPEELLDLYGKATVDTGEKKTIND